MLSPHIRQPILCPTDGIRLLGRVAATARAIKFAQISLVAPIGLPAVWGRLRLVFWRVFRRPFRPVPVELVCQTVAATAATAT